MNNQFSPGERIRYSQGHVKGDADIFLSRGETAIVLLFDSDVARPVVDAAPQAMAILAIGLRPFDSSKCLWGYDDRLDPDGLVYLFRFFLDGETFVQRTVGVLPRALFYALIEHPPLE